MWRLKLFTPENEVSWLGKIKAHIQNFKNIAWILPKIKFQQPLEPCEHEASMYVWHTEEERISVAGEN